MDSAHVRVALIGSGYAGRTFHAPLIAPRQDSSLRMFLEPASETCLYFHAVVAPTGLATEFTESQSSERTLQTPTRRPSAGIAGRHAAAWPGSPTRQPRWGGERRRRRVQLRVSVSRWLNSDACASSNQAAR
ncbi:MAG: hypothetical protein DMF95_15440 [Acidobacteria bacterium]|nr:MAG: hypothetical protein DMF94_21740 [Acidobacteriota bacterium]PYR47877.1 MAG: hypothetical protein DMF95_15440 [Acidobacteriota bacterium]